MTPEEFSIIRAELRLSNRQLGKLLDVHYRTVQSYGSGRIAISEWVIKKLDKLRDRFRKQEKER